MTVIGRRSASSHARGGEVAGSPALRGAQVRDGSRGGHDLAAMPHKGDAEVFQVLIREAADDGNVDAFRRKGVGVLRKTQTFEPFRNVHAQSTRLQATFPGIGAAVQSRRGAVAFARAASPVRLKK